eukprot:scaffold216321_cov33-Tisochrysis_lutea.AAC.1
MAVVALTALAVGFCVNDKRLLEHWQHSDLNGTGLDRWLNYANHYEQHFPRPNALHQIRMLEIGIQSGGSAIMWSSCYGETMEYIGIDIDPACKRFESPHRSNMHFEIGSSLNKTFLLDVCRKYGPFDIVVDDGGHTAEMINSAVNTIFASNACMTPQSVYVVEDMHVMANCFTHKSYCGTPGEISGAPCVAFESMHDYWFKSPRPLTPFSGRVAAIHLYDSIAFYVRSVPQLHLQRLRRGRFAHNLESALNPSHTYDRRKRQEKGQ